MSDFLQQMAKLSAERAAALEPVRESDLDKPVGDLYSVAVTQTGPVLVNQFCLTRTHKVVAVIIKDKEITVLSVDHGRQHLRYLKHGGFVVG